MKSTKNDLSFNKAELDFQAMLKTAAVAFGQVKESLHRELALIENTHFNERRVSSVYLETFKNLAESFAIVGETYNTLLEATKRENLTIINKPEVNRDSE